MEGEKEVNGNGIEDKYIKWFSDLNNKHISIVGGKGASLGEMFNNKFPVPPGFVITAQAFEYFINQMELRERISEIIQGIDFEDTEGLQKASKEIRGLIEEKEIPLALKEEILEAYHILGSEKIDEKGVSQDALTILKNAQEPIFVSVRSSATTEDLADASFAGQQESFLNIKGDTSLIEHVKRCFSSLYTARAIYYRNKKGFKEGDSLLAVVIQKMVDSDRSGVVFSRNPINMGDDIVLEAVFGLGEGIVAGKIRPDHYIISRDLKIKNIKVEEKKIAIVRNSGGKNETVNLSSERSKSQTLTNGEALEIANLAIKLEDHYKKPQDIEFAIEAKKIYIVQSRPITTKAKASGKQLSGNVVVKGLGASPGVGVGVVKIVEDMSDLSKIKKSDVLVTKMTNPDMVVSMQKSVAIITDEGGMTSHASIVSREMGIPAIVGTGDATDILKDGVKVTVDGDSGQVFEGEVAETQKAEIKPAVEVNKVKLKLIVDLPEFAERAAESGVDAIGLTRLEGIIASSNKHPLKYEKEDKLEDYIELLRKGIEKIAQPFKMMWIRASDIRTDEYSSLEGAPEKEINPMLGLHGARFLLKHPKILQAELLAIEKVAEKYPDKKIGVMFPLVISIEELRELKKYAEEIKIDNMQIGVMIETPAAVQIIDDICKEGVDFISFGTNDLTQFTLGVDRGEDEVQYLYNESHPAVLAEIKYVIDVCKKNNVETSICGQAGSKPDMVMNLFKWGIDSISLNADAASDISTLIKKMEDDGVEQEEVQTETPTDNAQNNISENQQSSQQSVQESQIIEKPKNEVEVARDEREHKKKNPRLVNCADCGNETKLPFKPRKNRDYYCKNCFNKRKNKKNEKQDDVQGTEVKELPEFSDENKGKPVTIEDVEKLEEHEERLLNQDKIKYSAEVEDRIMENPAIEKAQEITESYDKNIGSVEPIENLDRIEEKAEEIHEQVEQENEEKADSYDDAEESVEVSGGAVDGTESIGVYNPNEEENKDNSPPKYNYAFDDEYD
tara:strand:+ start:6199 stop:9243 length:3045 start_codon:yes stop_codon:yes gene_type:complete